MAISTNLLQRLRNSVIESTVTANQAAQAVVNPDGTNIGAGTSAGSLGKAEDAAHTTGDTGVMALAVRNDANVAIATTDLDYIPLSTDAVGALRVGGSVAHNVTDTGNPVKTGGLAKSTNPTKVTDGFRVNALYTLAGKQVVAMNGPRELVVQQHTEIASSSAETTIVTAGAAGVFHDITHLTITNQTAAAVNVTIKDATAGTTRKIIALAASGGITEDFSTPWTQSTTAANWTVTLSSAAVTVDIFAQVIKNT